MEIRLATTADLPLIRDLAEEVWWAHYPEIITDEQIRFMLDEWYSVEALSRQIKEEGHQFWLITPQGATQPRGYLSMSRHIDPGSYYLHKFYLANRGKGIGARAFLAVLEQYPDWQKVRLNVNRRNFRSVNFYFKMGFVIESNLDLVVGDGRFVMDDFVMIKKRVFPN
jgi:RimJ/RimL family protein N-acetyltransferase